MLKKIGPLHFVRSIGRILAARPQLPASLRDNELLQVILQRRSVRRFADCDIPEDAWQAVLEAGRLAPSTVNLQTWTFAVFDRHTWQQTFGRPLPFKARRAVMVMADIHRQQALAELFPGSPLVAYTIGVVNASLAAMAMNLAAEALGVSSVMLSETGRSGLLDAGYLKQTLRLPDGVFPLMTIVFGYASRPYAPMPPKLPLEQICCNGTYREADPQAMADWLAQMLAGYKASRPFSSFEAQLRVYRDKIGQAEADLQAMVYNNGRK
jgi:nitroreductase